MGKPAARIADVTAHGGTLTGPGCPTVLIGKMPAIRLGDQHVCPMVTPGTPPVPHVGGPVIGPGCPTVLIGKMPAAVMGDLAFCVGPPASILTGSPTVLIGSSPPSGGGGGGAGADQASTARALEAGTVKPVEGTESFPIEIQATILDASRYLSSENLQAQIAIISQALNEAGAGEDTEETTLTIADFADILSGIEKQEGYEAARFFASHLDYSRITELARDFVSGNSSDENNDPNVMPTKYMLIYGADDGKLRQIDDHPDRFDNEEHKITVGNLRRGLRLLGYELAEEGAFDNELYLAFVRYLAARTSGHEPVPDEPCIVRPGEDLGTLSERFGLPSWRYLYELNKDSIGDNPDVLKPGTELVIPRWDNTGGDEKIEEAGGSVFAWTGGLRYRYVWVPMSITPEVTDYACDAVEYDYSSTREPSSPDNSELVDADTVSPQTKPLSYEEEHEVAIYMGAQAEPIVDFSIKSEAEFRLLVPDSPNLRILIDGVPFSTDRNGDVS